MSNRVFVGVPLHAPPCDAFRRGYFELVTTIQRSAGSLNGWKARWYEQGGGGLPLARNYCAAIALREKYDVLLFMAGDIGATGDLFSKEITRVLSHFDRPAVNVVGGCYLHKRTPLRLVANQDETRLPDAHGLIQVRETGLDFLAVRVSVLQKIVDDWERISRSLYRAVVPLAWESYIANDSSPQGTHWNFFGMATVYDDRTHGVVYLPEDFYFLRLCREAGFKIQIDTKIRLQHWGSHNFDAATATGLDEAIGTINPPLPAT